MGWRLGRELELSMFKRLVFVVIQFCHSCIGRLGEAYYYLNLFPTIEDSIDLI